MVDKDNALARLRSDIAERDATMAGLRSELQRRDDAHRQVVTAFSDLRTELAELRSELTHHRSERQALVTRYEDVAAERERTIAQLRTHLAHAESMVARERQRRESLDASVQREYEHMKQRLVELVEATIPRGATVLMVSRGDETLVGVNGRRTWHFPQTAEGAWAGHYPADSQQAIAEVDRLRARGGSYLVFPNTARWWLDHYKELRTHLEHEGQIIVDRPDTGVIFSLRAPQWQHQLRAAFGRVRSQHGREPAVLDWNSELNLAVVFPDLTVFAPPEDTVPLPYLDHSVDVVVCTDAAEVVEEARRVASVLLVAVTSVNHDERDGVLTSPVLRCEWLAPHGRRTGPRASAPTRPRSTTAGRRHRIRPAG
jgi:hypothetical protein